MAWEGLYRAIVVENKDKENRGRVQITCAEVLGDNKVWADACFTPNLITLPDKGDLVWIMFEGGNRNYPVWMGCRYSATKIGLMTGGTPLKDTTILLNVLKTAVSGLFKPKEATIGDKKVAVHGEEVLVTVTHTTGSISGSTAVTSISPSKGSINVKRT